MTSQIDNESMTELKAEAKKLGVKGVHLFKTEESLQAKVDSMKEPVIEQKVAEPEPVTNIAATRKTAPKMSVSSISRDDREELIKELKKGDPNCEYLFEKGTITDVELKAKGLERKNHSIRNDIVVRTDKEAFKQYYDAKRGAQERLMKSVDTDGTRIKSFTENRKSGT